MARTLFIVLVLAATAYASKNKYAFNQEDEIISRVDVCLKPVPQNPSSFDTPAATCQMKARWSLTDGNAKESLAASIAACLTSHRPAIAASIVATAKQCLAQSLAKPLQPALKEADYSSKQRDEISNRIKACLTSIPETKYRTPASDCRNNALIRADEGYPKESLVNFIVPCLTGKKISSTVVATAQKCIVASLAKAL